MMLSPGENIGGCRIRALCGQGAYGQVYLAEDALGKQVAVKLLLNAEAGEYELKGLRNYLSVAKQVPGLLQVYLCGMHEGVPFYVMEAADNASEKEGSYLPDTLALRLKRSGRIPVGQALSIVHTLLSGLETLHDAGLIHRDIKPENIIFVQGEPKLADPGLTRNVEQTLSVAGTPGYIPPEFYSGQAEMSPTFDIYAMGKLLYHIVTGCPPGEFPHLPEDLPEEVLWQVCRPLARLCTPSPEKRCKSAAEANRILPRTIVKHNALQRWRDALVMRPACRRRALARAGIVLMFVLLVVGATVWGCHQLKERTRARSRELALLQEELDALEALRPRLELQLGGEVEACSKARLSEIRSLLEAGELERADKALVARKGELAECAVEHLPLLANGDFRALADGYGYLSSPLGISFLPEKQRVALEKELAKMGVSQTSAGGGFVPGMDFTENNYFPFSMTFVPPGRFVSPLLNAARRIDYPFWMFTTEVSGALFAFTTKYPPKRNPSEHAVEFLTWNDALTFCQHLNEILVERRTLPPGYGLRLPTEEEWEYAALGGWAGEQPVVREIPPKSQCAAPGTEHPNALGLCGMDDNLSELVLPYQERPSTYLGWVVARGSNYTAAKTGIASRSDYIRDQNHNRGSGGIRPVMAPIDADYWKKQWFRGPEIKHVSEGGEFYAGWAACMASTSVQKALQLAEDCGGTLPVLLKQEEVDHLYKQLSLPRFFPFFQGIRMKEGKWRRTDNGQEVALPSTVQASGTKTCLGYGSKGYFPIAETMTLPTVLLKWADEASFNHRGASFLERAKVSEFQVGGRHFAVCRVKLQGYLMRPFAQFMGLRLPSFSSADELEAVVARIPTELDFVGFGSIRFYRWYEQPNGEPLPKDVKVDESELFTEVMGSQSMTTLMIVKGKLCPKYGVQYILVELP